MHIFSYELSKHRTRPPTMGIHRRTRLNVVDNSSLGKEAHTSGLTFFEFIVSSISGKLAYCIHVYKQGKRQRHMPHATLGDKVSAESVYVVLSGLPLFDNSALLFIILCRFCTKIRIRIFLNTVNSKLSSRET